VHVLNFSHSTHFVKTVPLNVLHIELQSDALPNVKSFRVPNHANNTSKDIGIQSHQLFKKHSFILQKLIKKHVNYIIVLIVVFLKSKA